MKASLAASGGMPEKNSRWRCAEPNWEGGQDGSIQNLQSRVLLFSGYTELLGEQEKNLADYGSDGRLETLRINQPIKNCRCLTIWWAGFQETATPLWTRENVTSTSRPTLSHIGECEEANFMNSARSSLPPALIWTLARICW